MSWRTKTTRIKFDERRPSVQRALPLLGSLWAPVLAAANWAESPGLLELTPEADPNRSRLFRQLRLTVDGWIDAGYTYNAAKPSDGFNGPVTFNDRSRTFLLNQLYLYLERPVNVQGTDWDLGGRADFVFGTDAAFTQTFGDPDSTWDSRLLDKRFYQVAFPQTYLELFAPFGSGISVKLGHFYTIIGSESVMAPDNFFYSHAYTMQYGEPFTHTGVLGRYSLTEEIEVSIGAVTGSQFGGWDGAFDRSLENWGFLGGVTWASSSGETTASLNGSYGETRDKSPVDIGLYSLVLQHDITPSVHYRFQQDYGWLAGGGAEADAAWYGIVQYLTVDLAESWDAGLRAEWFRDDAGVRVLAPAREPALGPEPASYFAVTAGINWRPFGWLTLRQNVRSDWSDGTQAFDAGTRGSQLLLSWDVILLL